MRKKKKQRKPISTKELVFNIVSLLLLISVGVFYETRAYHFYNVEVKKKILVEATLNGSIIDNNKVTTEGAGLYNDKEGHFFRGDVNNNYVKFGNRLFRVIRVNNDGSVKVISQDLVSIFMNGNTNYGNGNVKKFLNKTDNKINATDLSGVYYDTIPNGDYFLKPTKYTIDNIKDGKVTHSDKVYKDYITSLTLDDYIKADGKNSFLNIGKYFYIIGTEGEDEILSVYEDGTIQAIDSSDTSGVRAVFTFKKNLKVSSGNGTIEDPYTINQKNLTNYVDGYVRLGDNIWKVFYDKDRILKLALNGYYMENNSYVTSKFSNDDNIFNEKDRKNIGYLLNHDFYRSVNYNMFFGTGHFYNGSIGEENLYNYQSIFTDRIYSKVGLLNMFDYNNTLFLDDYYLINSNDQSTVYVYRNNGILEETTVTDEKLVVPVIMIDKAILKRGNGSIEDPYMV